MGPLRCALLGLALCGSVNAADRQLTRDTPHELPSLADPAAGRIVPASAKLDRLGKDGQQFRDLNHDGILEPFEDWRLPPLARAQDLLTRMTLEEKAGALMHGNAPTPGGLAQPSDHYDLTEAEHLILGSHVTAFITRLSVPAQQLADQNNQLQTIATRSRLGIPLLISTDPRNHFDTLLGASVAASGFSQWPGPLGLAATGDPELVQRFADIARQEYRAVGIQMALSPQADLATEPRWPRIEGTFGEDPARVAEMVRAYVTGFQHGTRGIGPDSVATVVKHWVGYGASANGFDGHNSYGRYASLRPSSLQDHVRPFEAAFAAGVAGVMPTYDIVRGVQVDGQPLEAVGAAFSSQLLTGLLRQQQRFRGLVLSDWAVTKDCGPSCMTGTPPQMPSDIAMPWGVEALSSVERFAKALNAGVDQFGGVTDSEQVIEAVRSGRASESRLNESVLRVLELKFRLGLFEQPFVDTHTAAALVGSQSFVLAGLNAQHRSLVLLENSGNLLPLSKPVRKVFVHGLAPELLHEYGWEAASDPAQADVAILRMKAPHELLHPNFFFGRRQHEGSLDFSPENEELELLATVSKTTPTVVVILLDRPAILSTVRAQARALVAEFGASDRAVLDVLAGRARPQGQLPFELPSSMAAVEAQQPDLPHDSANPLYPIFFGLHYRP